MERPPSGGFSFYRSLMVWALRQNRARIENHANTADFPFFQTVPTCGKYLGLPHIYMIPGRNIMCSILKHSDNVIPEAHFLHITEVNIRTLALTQYAIKCEIVGNHRPGAFIVVSVHCVEKIGDNISCVIMCHIHLLITANQKRTSAAIVIQ